MIWHLTMKTMYHRIGDMFGVINNIHKTVITGKKVLQKWILCYYIPVSYTHLDVYKRQPIRDVLRYDDEAYVLKCGTMEGQKKKIQAVLKKISFSIEFNCCYVLCCYCDGQWCIRSIMFYQKRFNKMPYYQSVVKRLCFLPKE